MSHNKRCQSNEGDYYLIESDNTQSVFSQQTLT